MLFWEVLFNILSQAYYK